MIIFAEVWKTTPFIALLLLGGLALVPDDLYKAAKMDGASAWQRFTKITLPLIRPALMVAVLFRTLDAFRIYDAAFIITRGANDTETVSILGYNQLVNRLNLGLGSAVAILIFVCVMLIAFIFFRFLGANPQQQEVRRTMTETTQRQKILWAIGTFVVLFYALIPVRLDHLAVAEGARDDRRPEVLPVQVAPVGQLQRGVRGGPGLQPRPDQLDRHRDDHHR